MNNEYSFWIGKVKTGEWQLLIWRPNETDINNTIMWARFPNIDTLKEINPLAYAK